MEQISYDDFDCFFLRVQEELKYAVNVESMEEQDFGMGFRIRIPEEFIPADEETAADIFWSDKRPPVILLAPDRSAGLTFQLLADDGGRSGSGQDHGSDQGRAGSQDHGSSQGHAGQDHPGRLWERREEIKRILERIDDRTVFYGTGEAGEDGKVYWMEYKSFAADEIVYNILFLFQAEEETVMGTFYCVFEEYDKRRPMVLDMFSTII